MDEETDGRPDRTEAVPVVSPDALPEALLALPEIRRGLEGKKTAFFLDLDGTLAPIEDRPDLVELPGPTRKVIEDLARVCPVAVVSGRGLDDLRDKIGIRSVYYVADHGFQILGPVRSGLRLEVGAAYRPQLRQAALQLGRTVESVEGALVEEKGLSLSVHYRLVPEPRRAAVLRAVADVAESFPGLRVTEGKMVYEFRPPDEWDKGKAVLWLMERLGLQEGRPVVMGDDLTDEDMFRAVGEQGICVIVGEAGRPTLAGYRVRDHLAAAALLEALAAYLSDRPAQAEEVKPSIPADD